MTDEPTPATVAVMRDRVHLWIALGAALYVAGAIVSLVAIAWLEQLVLAPLGLGSSAGEPSLSLRNGAHAVLWGAAVAASAALLGPRFVPGLRLTGLGWGVLAAGLVLAGATTFLVEEFVRARFGMYEPRATGLTIVTGPALVAIALTSWAVLSVPRRSRDVLVILDALAGIGVIASMVPSLPGGLDGIRPASLPIVGVFAVDGLFVLATLLLAMRRGRSGLGSPDH